MIEEQAICVGCDRSLPLVRRPGRNPEALCDDCDQNRESYIEAHRPRSIEETMSILIEHAWCGNATESIRALPVERQEALLARLSPGLASRWRSVLGLPAETAK